VLSDNQHLMEVYDDLGRHIDAWDMAGPFVRKIAWEPRWIPELDRETVLIERLFYPEKWIFHRLQLAACDPRQGGVGNMVNCGAAMYAAPIGVVNACDPEGAYAEALAFMSGHQQSYGLEAACVFAACVAEALRPGADTQSVVDVATRLAKDGTDNAIKACLDACEGLRGAPYEEVVAVLQKALLPFSPMGDDVRHGPEKAGVATAAYQPSRLLSIEELPLALAFMELNDGDFSKTIEDGVNSGRDTDSIAVMSGALIGAMQGDVVVNPKILDRLNERNRLDLMRAAELFSQSAAAIISNDMERLDKRRDVIGRLTGERCK
ncbi:MAG TPA: hypothetical protein DIT93_15990, partial [Pelagibacterium sp.]|nr:hypothetical protein [Pelagibacterium sp.]